MQLLPSLDVEGLKLELVLYQRGDYLRLRLEEKISSHHMTIWRDLGQE